MIFCGYVAAVGKDYGSADAQTNAHVAAPVGIAVGIGGILSLTKKSKKTA